jgi:hypothetical protein
MSSEQLASGNERDDERLVTSDRRDNTLRQMVVTATTWRSAAPLASPQAQTALSLSPCLAILGPSPATSRTPWSHRRLPQTILSLAAAFSAPHRRLLAHRRLLQSP